jgi:hypothetical protein
MSFVLTTGSAGPNRVSAESIIVRAIDEPTPNAKPSLRVWPKEGAGAVGVDGAVAGALENPFFFSKIVGVVG